jgi:hypothetical protein
MAQGAGLAVEFLAGRGLHHGLHSKYVGTYFMVIWTFYKCSHHVTAVGNGPTGRGPREQALLTLMPCALTLTWYSVRPPQATSGSVQATLGI